MSAILPMLDRIVVVGNAAVVTPTVGVIETPYCGTGIVVPELRYRNIPVDFSEQQLKACDQ